MCEQKIRCWWARDRGKELEEYHDNEWGVPVYDDHMLFEMLVLESFTAGLSWLIILKKRDAFREAFDNFDAEKISQYTEAKVEKLLENKGIVRSRAKIKATISNSKVFMDIQKEFGSFSNYLWGYTDNKVLYTDTDYIPTHTELSDRIAADLKRRGIKFFGTVTVYSYLQAVGVVNCHESYCFKYRK